MGKVLIGVLWVATLGVAYFLGSQPTQSEGARGTSEVVREDGSASQADPGPTLRAAPGAGRAAEPAASPPPSSGIADPAEDLEVPPDPFTLDGVTTMDEASERLMAHVSALLARGPEAHLELLTFFNDHVVENKELQSLAGGSDEEMARLLYPWIKFLIHRENQVVDLTETVYKTMAEDPQAIEEIDNDTLEIFTEGVAVILPGVVDEERLGEFRAYAEKIMEHPEETLPKSVQRQRRDVQRALGFWAPPMSADEALERIRSGNIPPGEALALLKRVPPEQLAGLDLAPILAPAVKTGDYRTINLLRRVPLAPADVDLLDRTVLEGAAEGRWHAWTVSTYLGATKRSAWPAPQSFVEQALSNGGHAARVFTEALAQLNPRPPRDYVQWVLETYELPEQTRKRLEAQFELGK